ncbi:MAG: hypothetical protein ACRC6M_03020 [Microcystaceae cyanobacterium]
MLFDIRLIFLGIPLKIHNPKINLLTDMMSIHTWRGDRRVPTQVNPLTVTAVLE